jgi:hypothetical protein
LRNKLFLFCKKEDGKMPAGPILAVFFIIALIMAIAEKIHIVGPLVILLIAIVIIVRSQKSAKKQRQQAEQEKKYEEARKNRAAVEKEKSRISADQRAQAETRFQEAIRRGIDVCRKCKTIQPKRCVCGACIASYSCGKSSRSDHECEKCYWKRKDRECDEAERKGIDVCRECRTIRPKRCEIETCRNCMNCWGDAGGGVCCPCGD